jgi:REP element-mobilizing transposase RayT
MTNRRTASVSRLVRTAGVSRLVRTAGVSRLVLANGRRKPAGAGERRDTMERYWLLTWRTYDTWLPGDERGFVDPIVDDAGKRVIHNVPGTPLDSDNPRLRGYAERIMKGAPVYLTAKQAAPLLEQLQETAAHRGWELLAVAILANHVHLVVGVAGDPDPADLLRDFKSYGSRRLNQLGKKPLNGSWWAESGSRRVLKTELSLRAAIRYVLEQEHALVTLASADQPGERPA